MSRRATNKIFQNQGMVVHLATNVFSAVAVVHENVQ
jgi:hypothetical protein